jgi:hypothetical protein
MLKKIGKALLLGFVGLTILGFFIGEGPSSSSTSSSTPSSSESHSSDYDTDVPPAEIHGPSRDADPCDHWLENVCDEGTESGDIIDGDTTYNEGDPALCADPSDYSDQSGDCYAYDQEYGADPGAYDAP